LYINCHRYIITKRSHRAIRKALAHHSSRCIKALDNFIESCFIRGDHKRFPVDKRIEQLTADKNIVADRHEDYEGRHAITDELEIRLNNINDALKKIEEGKYGVCEIGGEEIEEDRLEANPSAKTCKKHLNVRT